MQKKIKKSQPSTFYYPSERLPVLKEEVVHHHAERHPVVESHVLAAVNFEVDPAHAAVECRVEGDVLVDHELKTRGKRRTETGAAVNHVVSLHIDAGYVVGAVVRVEQGERELRIVAVIQQNSVELLDFRVVELCPDLDKRLHDPMHAAEEIRHRQINHGTVLATHERQFRRAVLVARHRRVGEQQFVGDRQSREGVGERNAPIVADFVARAQRHARTEVVMGIHVQVALVVSDLVVHADVRIESRHDLLDFAEAVLIFEEVVEAALIVTAAVVEQRGFLAAPKHAAADIDVETAVVPGRVVEGDGIADLLPLRHNAERQKHRKQNAKHYRTMFYIHHIHTFTNLGFNGKNKKIMVKGLWIRT